MNVLKRLSFIVLGCVLFLSVVACGCESTPPTPTPLPTPQPTVPPPTEAPVATTAAEPTTASATSAPSGAAGESFEEALKKAQAATVYRVQMDMTASGQLA